jgi:hypothetical protein
MVFIDAEQKIILDGPMMIVSIRMYVNQSGGDFREDVRLRIYEDIELHFVNPETYLLVKLAYA